jgi:hypothetical protein
LAGSSVVRLSSLVGLWESVGRGSVVLVLNSYDAIDGLEDAKLYQSFFAIDSIQVVRAFGDLFALQHSACFNQVPSGKASQV